MKAGERKIEERGGEGGKGEGVWVRRKTITFSTKAIKKKNTSPKVRYSLTRRPKVRGVLNFAFFSPIERSALLPLMKCLTKLLFSSPDDKAACLHVVTDHVRKPHP